MATYYADKAQPGVVPKYITEGDLSTIAIFSPATALAVGDTIVMMNVPALVYMCAVQLDVQGVDSGAGLRLSVGTGAYGTTPAVPGQFVQGAQPNAITTLNQPGVVGYQWPVQAMPETGYPVVVTVTAAPTTFVAGGRIALRVNYSADR